MTDEIEEIRQATVEEQIRKVAMTDRVCDLLLRANELLSEQIHQQRVTALGQERVLDFQYEHHSIRLWLPHASSDYIQRRILSTNAFYKMALLGRLKKLTPAGAVVCDVGAYIGSQTVFFAKCLQAAQVYAFESLAFSCEILRRNISLNQLEGRVTVHHATVARPGVRAVLRSFKSSNIGASSVSLAEEGDMACTSIDDMELDRLDLLNIDISAGQKDVLQGAQATIRRLRPNVLVSLGTSDRDVIQLLTEWDMKQLERLGPTEHLFSFN